MSTGRGFAYNRGMKRLALAFGALLLFAVGVGGTLAVQRLAHVGSANQHIDIYVDRTPAPEEVAIRRAAQKLLDDYNNGQWQAALDDFASFCRPAASAKEVAANWPARFHLELRRFRVTEVHDKTALVDSGVLIWTDESSSPFGPDHGAKPWLNSFTFEDGQWRACQ